MYTINLKIKGTKSFHKLSETLIHNQNVNQTKLFVAKNINSLIVSKKKNYSTMDAILDFVDYSKQYLDNI